MRYLYIQVFRSNNFSEIIKIQGEERILLPAIRGTIHDRKFRPLAENVVHYDFAIHPNRVENRDLIVSTFSKVTGRSKEYYENRLDSDKTYEFLERNLKHDESKPLLTLKDKGLVAHKHSSRLYPHGHIASQIIGFTNIDGKGLEGLEWQYDVGLIGKTGWIILETDGHGKSRKNQAYPIQKPVDGNNLVLTIDAEYQAILQDELERSIASTGAAGGMGIILEPFSGKILAMSSLPDYDSNTPSLSQQEFIRNRVITDQYEPGSTFKIVPALAAIHTGKVNIKEEFNCENGSYDFLGTTIKDWSDFSLLTFSQIIEKSSNVGVIKIAERVGAKDLYRFARKFGFGSESGISFPGETKGRIRTVDEWSKISITQVPLGHEVSVTTLQIALAYAAIANGGYLMKPILVGKILNAEGQIIHHEKPQIVRKISSTENIASLKSMLQQVVESGTGTSAHLAGWNVAGKTGTAQKFIDGEYSKMKFISSFAGFFPTEDPQLVGVFVLDEPRKGQHWGGLSAAPIFSNVMKRIIYQDDEILVHKPRLKSRPTPLPESPPADLLAGRQENAPLALMTVAVEKINPGVIVPNLQGMSLRSAISTVKKFELTPKVEGSGAVVYQWPIPGTEVSPGSTCSIKLN
jgi:cell division protein FtsI/penicillin-binding protein 2|tara:strand:- start:239 stop:2137 length:1899 start_codon:yes stop_codon:yes gene_type:complete